MWQFQQALFAHQGDENSGWVTEELVREVAAEMPGLDVDELVRRRGERRCERAGPGEPAQRFSEAAATGTPTLLIQIGDDEPYMIQVGLDPAALAAALDDALAG